jgi:hypothetical protein
MDFFPKVLAIILEITYICLKTHNLANCFLEIFKILGHVWVIIMIFCCFALFPTLVKKFKKEDGGLIQAHNCRKFLELVTFKGLFSGELYFLCDQHGS